MLLRTFGRFKLLLPCLALGCEASVQADVKTGASAEVADFDKPLEAAQEKAPALAEAADTREPETALLGARHDLRLATAGQEASCQCLSTALGLPSAPGMVWRSEQPVVDPKTQLVVALSSAGQSCTGEPKGSLGASYWGYRQAGNDVIVIVEAAREGRPVTQGGIIPKPIGDGQVYVEPITPGLPYGKPVAAASGAPKGTRARCALGNPGPRRAAPAQSQESMDSEQP